MSVEPLITHIRVLINVIIHVVTTVLDIHMGVNIALLFQSTVETPVDATRRNQTLYVIATASFLCEDPTTRARLDLFPHSWLEPTVIATPTLERRRSAGGTHALQVRLRSAAPSTPGENPLAALRDGIFQSTDRMYAHAVRCKRLGGWSATAERAAEGGDVDDAACRVEPVPACQTARTNALMAACATAGKMQIGLANATVEAERAGAGFSAATADPG